METSPAKESEPGTDLLRASRDGDQFHYHWAALQSLRLLMPGTDLTAIAVEGVSSEDTRSKAGEDVIDLAEYHGAVALQDAKRVVYRQLKHSSANSDVDWTVSGLSKTVTGFAEKFRSARSEFPGAEHRISFEFITNRPVRQSVLHAIEAIAAGEEPAELQHDIKYLRQYAQFGEDPPGEAQFFASFKVSHRAAGLLSLEVSLRSAVAGFLPGVLGAEPVLLKEMVTRRATNLELDNVIVRETVLAALGVPDVRLLPAHNRIKTPDQVIVTSQAREVLTSIVERVGRPFVVHATGGVGKSVLATQLESALPAGSVAVLYDCFGNGDYRRSSMPRHQHRQGMVQIANELASRALCHPLVPSDTASPSDYSRAFMVRVWSAAEAVAAETAGALLAIVVDAADNAALVARDIGERCFALDLLREEFPVNVRLVVLCRTERIELLNPPPQARLVELEAFGPEATARHLAQVFDDVSANDAAEFQRRTGGNPRVQAMVMESASSIESCLASLGEAAPREGGVLLDGLLESLVAKTRDSHHSDAHKIDLLCTALAALRPRIPIRVLSKACDVTPALIRSFAADVGRPLLVDGDALQFRDEPTETWFRSRFRPSGASLARFIDEIMPLAGVEPYVAASLPQLLWEADQVDVLVDLALTDQALPQDDDLGQREIAQQRVQYALRATLRTGREAHAARLALKAGDLAAGRSRQVQLLRDNTDLAGRSLDPQTIEDIVADRSLAGKWPGSHLLYEGGLLSAAAGQTGFARSRLRSASEWMSAWAGRERKKFTDREDRVTVADVAEVAFGLLNTDGVSACVGFVSGWRPETVEFRVGQVIASRLADAGRLEELFALGLAFRDGGQLAVADAAWTSNITCDEQLARHLAQGLLQRQGPVCVYHHVDAGLKSEPLPAVVWIVAMGVRHGVLSDAEAEQILAENLPEDLARGSAGEFGGKNTEVMLCGFWLLARLRGRPLVLDDIAGSEVVEGRGRPHASSRAVAEFDADVAPSSAWAELLTDCMLGAPSDLAERFGELCRRPLRPMDGGRSPQLYVQTRIRLGARILACSPSAESCAAYRELISQPEFEIYIATLTDALRVMSAVRELSALSYEVAEKARMAVRDVHDTSEGKAGSMAALARAIYRLDPEESSAYFSQAIALTDQLGDDAFVVCRTLLALSRAAATPELDDSRRAYRVGQLVEGFGAHLDDIDHGDALAALASLSAGTAASTASRWRDRRICSEVDFATAFATDAYGPTVLDPLVALALLPLKPHRASPLEMLQEVIRNRPDAACRASTTFGTLMRPRRFSMDGLKALERTADAAGIDLHEMMPEEFWRPAAPSDSGAADAGRPSDDRISERRQRLRAELAQYDLATPAGWDQAFELIKRSEHALSPDDVVRPAASLPPHQLAAMIAAFKDSTYFGVFTHASMIDELLALPTLTQAVRRQLRTYLPAIAAKFWRELTCKSYNPVPNLARMADVSELSDRDLIGVALRSAGSQPGYFRSEDCYALACTLARRLPAHQAQTVLDDATQMLTDIAPLDFGDGEFDSLEPVPTSVAECLAGYLWAALGAPDTGVRWRAAHCVRLMAELGCDLELEALNGFATGATGFAPFYDARLPFYDLHARQWLLYSLARSALDPASHDRLRVFVPLLKRVVFEDHPHVVIQGSAAEALLSLASGNVVALTDQELDICRSVNTPASTIRQNWRQRRQRTGRRAPGTHVSTDGFYGFMDFAEHWCEPLANAFGLDMGEVEARVSETVAERWGRAHRGRFNDDPRWTHRIYPRDGTYVYKDDWPEFEDLGFYLATHALCSVAGELVATHPSYCEVDDFDGEEDLFADWFARFALSRGDRRWLADRRDAAPDSIFTDEDRGSEPDWVWQLSPAHFSSRLLDGAWVRVWEDSEEASYRATQEVVIRSALVTPDKGRALVLAMQTASSYMDYRLPDAGEELEESSSGGYKLVGWIVDDPRRRGQDSRDPLASPIGYPPPYPAPAYSDALGIVPDEDMRLWSGTDGVVARTVVWDDGHRERQHRMPGRNGRRLEIQRKALDSLLASMQQNLVVEVMMHRDHDDRKKIDATIGRSDGEFSYLEWSYKVYLFDGAGRIFEL